MKRLLFVTFVVLVIAQTTVEPAFAVAPYPFCTGIGDDDCSPPGFPPPRPPCPQAGPPWCYDPSQDVPHP